jgi:hypothetical protein
VNERTKPARSCNGLPCNTHSTLLHLGALLCGFKNLGNLGTKRIHRLLRKTFMTFHMVNRIKNKMGLYEDIQNWKRDRLSAFCLNECKETCCKDFNISEADLELFSNANLEPKSEHPHVYVLQGFCPYYNKGIK